MSRLLKRATNFPAAGFSLIELLVVIGILAIMAAALIATIDPFEQLKKAQDATLKEMAVEFVSANERYYGTHNSLPWFSAANGGADCYASGNTLSAVALSNLTTCLQTLASEGELKQGFVNASRRDKVFATNPNPQTSNATDTIACFLPDSKSQQRDANTKYAQDGNNGNNCKSTGGANNCYWCAQ